MGGSTATLMSSVASANNADALSVQLDQDKQRILNQTCERLSWLFKVREEIEESRFGKELRVVPIHAYWFLDVKRRVQICRGLPFVAPLYTPLSAL